LIPQYIYAQSVDRPKLIFKKILGGQIHQGVDKRHLETIHSEEYIGELRLHGVFISEESGKKNLKNSPVYCPPASGDSLLYS
jgi:hypothetical protein